MPFTLRYAPPGLEVRGTGSTVLEARPEKGGLRSGEVSLA
jgi:hypothetical protein